jgi:imidazolonepropionase-like amidohydrolase
LWPAIVDSHVHLTYWPVIDELAKSGVAAAVDLAAPESAVRPLGLDSNGKRPPIAVFASGPMLTRPGGYPLESWGREGYGIGCADAACVTATIERLKSKGAHVVKLALDDNGLAPALVAIAIQAAHERQMKVAVHALSNASALLAGTAGADLLAHTPVEPLTSETIAAWKVAAGNAAARNARAVISTLAAFGGEAGAIDNLRALHENGVAVLYGTDLGNLRDPGPSKAEMDLLRRAGLDEAELVEAMTTRPAAFWQLTFAIAQGGEASFLVLDRDPRTDANALLEPREVWLRGRRVK